MLFAQLNISKLPENVTVDIPIVLLKILLGTCEQIFYIQNRVQYSLFCETENLMRFHGQTINRFSKTARFTYVRKNNCLLYLCINRSGIHKFSSFSQSGL